MPSEKDKNFIRNPFVTTQIQAGTALFSEDFYGFIMVLKFE